MVKRIGAAVLAAAMMGGLLTGCSRDEGMTGSGTAMKLTFLNSKGEIQEGLEAVAKQYKDKTGVEIEILVAPAGTSPSERFSQLYNSGTPPTMSMLDTTDVVDIGWEKAVDLTDEKWVAEAGDQAYRIDGKGRMEVFGHMKKPFASLPDLPRVGLRFFLEAGMEQVSYLGYGPTES